MRQTACLIIDPITFRTKLLLAFSYLLAEKSSCSAMFNKKKTQLLVILDLLAGQISCSAKLSMKKSFITSLVPCSCDCSVLCSFVLPNFGKRELVAGLGI